MGGYIALTLALYLTPVVVHFDLPLPLPSPQLQRCLSLTPALTLTSAGGYIALTLALTLTPVTEGPNPTLALNITPDPMLRGVEHYSGYEYLRFHPLSVVTPTALSRLDGLRNARRGDSLALARSAAPHVAQGRRRRRASVAVWLVDFPANRILE